MLKCLNCDQPLTDGRSDRKFCNGKCRSAYHYSLNRSYMLELYSNSKAIAENEKILEKHYEKYGDADASRIKLKYSGLKAERFTLMFKTVASGYEGVKMINMCMVNISSNTLKILPYATAINL